MPVPTPAAPTPAAVPAQSSAVPNPVNSDVATAEVAGNLWLLGVNPLAAGLPLMLFSAVLVGV